MSSENIIIFNKTIPLETSNIVAIINGVSMTQNDMNENLGLGILYIITSLFFVLITTFILYIFLKEDTYRKNISYQIMIVSEFLNVPQQIIHGYSGFYSIFNFTSGETIDKILGGLLQSGYMFSMPLSTILALNRLDVLTRQKYFKSIDRIYIFWSLLGITLLYGIIIFALLNTPYIGLYYGLQDVSWHYLRTEYRLLAKEIEYYTCIIFVLLTFIIYIIIIGFIMKNRLENDESKKSTVIQVSSNPVKISLEQKKSFARKALTFASTKKKIFEKREQSLLIQCVLNFIYIAILEICWYFGDYFLPVTRWRAIGLNYVWICNTGISSVLYLIVLKDVRSRMYSILVQKNKKNGVSVLQNNRITMT